MATFWNAIPVLESQTSGQIANINLGLTRIDAMLMASIIDRDLFNPPGSPSEGDRYLIANSATGLWFGHDNEFTVYNNGWQFFAVNEGWQLRVEDEEIWIRYNGTSWEEDNSILGSVSAGLTASTTQTQGQLPLTSIINQISTCANVNDATTLPTAVKGMQVVVVNDGANALQVFPASGDTIDGGSADASVTTAAGKRVIFWAINATDWLSIATTKTS